MHRYETHRMVQHSADEMFALVADIEDYPEFVPLCERLKIRERTTEGDREVLIADMSVAYKLIRESFTSRVTLAPKANEILVEYLDGPFSHLENRWTFTPLERRECKVDFFIAYSFRSRMFEILVGVLFDKAVRKFATAFEQRADEVYGRDGPLAAASQA